MKIKITEAGISVSVYFMIKFHLYENAVENQIIFGIAAPTAPA